MEDTQNNVSWLLLRLSLRVKKTLIKLAEENNLTTMQALTICLLNPAKTLSMRSISDMLACDASNVTGIVDKLKRDGYIERKESDIDRRVNTVSLTQKGISVRTELLDTITKDYLQSMLQISEKEIFKDLLVKILEESSNK